MTEQARRASAPLERMTSAQRRWLLSANVDGIVEDPGNARARMPIEALLERDLLVEVPRLTRYDRRRYRRTPRADAWVATWKTNHPERVVRYSSPFGAPTPFMRYGLALGHLRADETRWDELHEADRLTAAQRAHGRPYITELLR